MRPQVQPARLRPIYRYLIKWSIGLAIFATGAVATRDAIWWYSEVSCQP